MNSIAQSSDPVFKEKFPDVRLRPIVGSLFGGLLFLALDQSGPFLILAIVGVFAAFNLDQTIRIGPDRGTLILDRLLFGLSWRKDLFPLADLRILIGTNENLQQISLKLLDAKPVPIIWKKTREEAFDFAERLALEAGVALVDTTPEGYAKVAGIVDPPTTASHVVRHEDRLEVRIHPNSTILRALYWACGLVLGGQALGMLAYAVVQAMGTPSEVPNLIFITFLVVCIPVAFGVGVYLCAVDEVEAKRGRFKRTRRRTGFHAGEEILSGKDLQVDAVQRKPGRWRIRCSETETGRNSMFVGWNLKEEEARWLVAALGHAVDGDQTHRAED